MQSLRNNEPSESPERPPNCRIIQKPTVRRESLTPLQVTTIRSTNQLRQGELLGRFSLRPHRENSAVKLEVPCLPEFQLIGQHQQQHLTERHPRKSDIEEVDERNNHYHSQLKAAPRTDRSFHRTPTEQLQVITLAPLDGRSQGSVVPSMSPQAIAEKLKSIVEDVWLVAFDRPFKQNLKCNQQRSELCGQVYSLKEAANRHREFVEVVAEALGADASNEELVKERCRETVDCLIQVDAVRQEQQQKLEEYLQTIDELTARVEEEVAVNKDLVAEINLRDQALQRLHGEHQELQQYMQHRSHPDRLNVQEGYPSQLEHLRISVQSLQKEKSELLLTIEREVTSLKESIELLVDEKIDLIKKLMAAQNYINELKITTDHQINDLTMALQRQRKVSASLTVSATLGASRLNQYASPSQSRNIMDSDTFFLDVAQHLEMLPSNQVDKKAVLLKLADANKFTEELKITVAVLQEYNVSLEQAIIMERQANRELRQEISGLQTTLEEVRLEICHRVTPRQHIAFTASQELGSSYRSKAERLEREHHDLLAFFDDLLENLAGRCAEENQPELHHDILELLEILQQKRRELPPRVPTNSSEGNSRVVESLQVPPLSTSITNSMITSPRPTTHEKLASPYNSPHLMMCSPQMCLKACKSNEKLAIRSDDLESFLQSVEQLFESFSEDVDADLLGEIMNFVKQLHLYPEHSHLFPLVQRLIESLKDLNFKTVVDQREEHINDCLDRMQRVFQEVQGGASQLSATVEQRIQTVELEYSEGASITSKVSPAQSCLSRQVEAAVQASFEEEAELEQIELIRDQIRCLQDSAQVFRDSMNLCLESSSKVERSRLCRSPSGIGEN